MRAPYLKLMLAGLSLSSLLFGQGRGEPGKPIGSISTRDNLIVMTLDEDVLGKANLFDLVHHTLRFTPEGSQYRVENIAFQWDGEFGPELAGSQATLKNFAFPFSGKRWNNLSIGMTGSMTFGEPSPNGGRAGAGRGGGIAVDRFAELQEAARSLVNTVPAISVFFKPRMSGTRHLKELDDRAVITWSLTEPVGGIQDMTWVPTVNRFQATLAKDGTILMSYDAVAAQDAIVGIYPVAGTSTEKEIATIPAEGARDLKSIKLTAVDGLFVKVNVETRGTALPEGDVRYRICIAKQKPTEECALNTHPDAMWTVQPGGGGRGRAAGGYMATGAGATPAVKVSGSSLSFQATLPSGYKTGDSAYVYATIVNDKVAPQLVKLADLSSPELHFSSAKKQDGPYAVAYESFHYMKPPRAVDLTCTVIKALGDKYDMLAYYSDFRIDNPEAGTSSSGPLGGGPAGGAVTGIGANQRNLASYCSQGRFQWQFIQPVYVGANQMQEYPPEGVAETNTHNVAAYTHQLAERTSNGKIPPYDYGISQIAHEMGHRWSAFVSAKIGDETIPLGPTHWARGLQAPVAFPYQRPTEASAMGGGVWQDNLDGTFTQLDDDYYVPATGWSYLDLYLMGMIAPSEVPDFFILRNLNAVGRDANGRPIFKGDRTKVTIQDVIAVQGPRLPDVDHAQKNFNTGMVVVVEHGKTPSKELLERTEGIRLRWMDYWETTTGHRSTMTTNPK